MDLIVDSHAVQGGRTENFYRGGVIFYDIHPLLVATPDD